jgi:two-component system, response regulator YesN
MLRVLIIEDNQIFREAFKTVLQDRLPSLVIEEAGNGEEAVRRINEAPPDLMFVDMRLGGMNGLELAQKIKKDFPLIRIAMLTGYDFPEYRRTASQYGVDRYFLKDSLDWKEVEDFFQYILKEKSEGKDGQSPRHKKH